MKIFFTGSYTARTTLQPAYDKIISVLKEKNVEIISREVQTYEDVFEPNIIKEKSPEELHYLFVRNGILKADGVIIESSADSFQLGHESGLALVYNKPVLCIAENWDFTRKIKHRLFHAKEYKSEKDIERYVIDFLKVVKNLEYSVRFNVRLSPAEKNFLDLLSQKVNRNASEIIRELIDREMNENTDISNLLNI